MNNSLTDDGLRCDALAGHFRNSRLALDRGTAQAKLGFFDIAAHEIYLVEQDIHLICRILVALDSEPSRKQLSVELDLILIRLNTLRLRIFQRIWEA
jgi:hypothetical protein